MTTIRVDPPILQDSSKTIQTSSATLKSIDLSITASARNAPSYDGQFGPQVRAIAADSSAKASHLSSVFGSLANRLAAKAQQFLNADNVSSANMGSQFNNLGWMALITIFPQLTFGIAFNSFLKKLFPNGINIWNHHPGNSPVIVDTAAQNPATSPGTNSFIASSVPIDDGRRIWDKEIIPDGYKGGALYYRGTGKEIVTGQTADGKSITKTDVNSFSNCTWYAAAAVNRAVGVDLNDGSKYTSLGHGGQWAGRAIDAKNYSLKPGDKGFNQGMLNLKNAIKDVNDIPERGSVISLPGGDYGHVAFVENAQYDAATKKWTVVVSEENLYGGPLKDAKPVSISGQPDVKRWTRTISLSANDNGGANGIGKFIHFNKP